MDIWSRRPSDTTSSQDSDSSSSQESDIEQQTGTGNMAQISVEQIMAILNGLTITSERLVQAAGGGGDRQQGPSFSVRLDNHTFPNLDLAGSDSDVFESFCEWEQTVRRIIQGNPGFAHIPVVNLTAAVLGCLRGAAQRRTRSILPEQQQSLDVFFQSLRDLFCGGAVAERARAMFLARGQREKEDINAFHAELLELWHRAYPSMDERQGIDWLRDRFLMGLRNKDVTHAIIMREEPLPPTYAELRVLALKFEGKFDSSRQMREGTAQPEPKPRMRESQSSASSAPIPMDVDVEAVQRYQRNNRPNSGGKGKGPGPSGTGQGARSMQGTGRPTQSHLTGDNKEVKGQACFRCGQEGHFARNCRARPSRGQQVNSLQEEAPPEEAPQEKPEESAIANEWAEEEEWTEN